MSYINKPNSTQTPVVKGWAHRGSQITTTANAAIERNNQPRSGKSTFAPLRFYVKAGDTTDIVILDDSMESGLAFYEHNLQDGEGRWSIYEPCLKDLGVACPMCVEKASSYVLFLSCIALKPYTTKKGTVVPHSKMLLQIRITQFDMFRQLEESAKNEGKSLRGMVLSMKRSKTDSKAPRIGEPAIGKGGKVYDIISEEEILSLFGHDALTSQDGAITYREENEDTQPYDYDAVFPRPDVNAIIARHGGKPSAESDDSTTGGDSGLPVVNEAVATRVLEMLMQKRKSSQQSTPAVDEDDIPF